MTDSISWSEMSKHPMQLTSGQMHQIGKIMVACVVREAKLQSLVSSAIPKTPEFFRSFRYRVTPDGVHLVCDWPSIKSLVEGKKPFRMAWLTRERGVDVVPIRQDDGTLVFRTAPLRMRNAWIHHGIARHTFIQRGIRRAHREILTYLKEDILNHLAKGNPLK